MRAQSAAPSRASGRVYLDWASQSCQKSWVLVNSSSVSPPAIGRTSPFHSRWKSADSPSARVKVAATPLSSALRLTLVRSTARPSGEVKTAPTPWMIWTSWPSLP